MALLAIVVLKFTASSISLGSGFRGGLFFASLMIGAYVGRCYADATALIAFTARAEPAAMAVVGLAALGTGIVGAPMSMTFLALEMTGDFGVTLSAFIASLIVSLVVRGTFGYSFATWRFHLRGETIRSAHDVGWIRNLTVRSMMRADVRTVDAAMPIAAFRSSFPLGSAQRVIAVDGEQRYVGIVLVPDAHTASTNESDGTIRPLLRYPDFVLIPPMNAKAAAGIFEKAKAEELAVVDGLKTRKVVGLLTEGHLMRRYAEELEKAHRDIQGDVE